MASLKTKKIKPLGTSPQSGLFHRQLLRILRSKRQERGMEPIAETSSAVSTALTSSASLGEWESSSGNQIQTSHMVLQRHQFLVPAQATRVRCGNPSTAPCASTEWLWHLAGPPAFFQIKHKKQPQLRSNSRRKTEINALTFSPCGQGFGDRVLVHR